MCKVQLYADGYPTPYLINKKGKIFYSDGSRKNTTIISSGYEAINIELPTGERKLFLVHRLMVETFIGAIPPKMVINHIDGCKTNNKLENLEITTYSGNMQHAVAHNLFPSGEKCYNSKYTNEQVHECCRLISTGKYSTTQIAEMTGIEVGRVRQIYHRDKWKKISKDYDFSKPLPVAGKLKKEPFSLRQRLIIYRLWDMGYANNEICCLLNFPRTQKIYDALWKLSRSKKRQIEPEKFNDYPLGFVFLKYCSDLKAVRDAKRKGPYKNSKHQE